MANWSNIRLVVVGPEKEVVRFCAGAKASLPTRKSRLGVAARQLPSGPEPLFRSDMIHGEGGSLFEEPLVRLSRARAQVQYVFQVPNDDGVDHFRKVSRSFPSLRFVLVWGDPNGDSFGSAYLRSGRAAKYEMGSRRKTAIYQKTMRRFKAHEDDEDGSWEWDAFSEMMDAALRRWRTVLDVRT